ncbi:MAG: hypothetical protein WDA72_09295, partial [Desulfomonilia bacterium]
RAGERIPSCPEKKEEPAPVSIRATDLSAVGRRKEVPDTGQTVRSLRKAQSIRADSHRGLFPSGWKGIGGRACLHAECRQSLHA